MEGYIKSFRKKLEWRWFRDPSVAHLFEYLTLRANYSDKEWQDRIIKRGQLISSRRVMSEETGLTEKTVRRCLNALKKTGEISIVTTNRYTLITIIKYSEYQGGLSEEGQQKAYYRPTIGHQKATNKDNKKVINQQASPLHPPRGIGDSDGGGIDDEVTTMKQSRSVSMYDATGYEVSELGFVAPEFRDPFFRWLRYLKAQHNLAYKSQDAIHACYSKMLELAGNDSLKAMEVVEYCIVHSWKNLYELNNSRYGNNTQKSIGDRIQRDAIAAAEFSRQLDQERRANLCGGDTEEVWEP